VLHWNAVAVGPPLNRGMVGVAQPPSDLPYAAEPLDDVGVIGHERDVRYERTNVKLDCVRALRPKEAMADGETVGQRLARLRARSGLSLEKLAKAAGYRGRSSVQRFFEPAYDKHLPADVAQQLLLAMEGKGEPPISPQEVFALTGINFISAERHIFTPGETVRNVVALPRDVPIYGTALGGEASFDKAGGPGRIRVEQATLDQAEVIGYLRRPPALEGRNDVYGVFISGESMYPRFNHGEPQFVDPKRPPSIGDDVVVHLRTADEQDGERVIIVLVKRLKRRNSAFIELEQFNPPAIFRIDAARVQAVHRIIPAGELLS
jgi:hypothetical protein